MHEYHWIIFLLDKLPSQEISLILGIIVSLGYFLLPLTLIIVGAIHPNIYVLSAGQMSNEYSEGMDTWMDIFLRRRLRSLEFDLISCGSNLLPSRPLHSITPHMFSHFTSSRKLNNLFCWGGIIDNVHGPGLLLVNIIFCVASLIPRYMQYVAILLPTTNTSSSDNSMLIISSI